MNIENNQEFEALCARLLPKFNEYLQRHSKNIFSCELATSLDGISSMPALYSLKGVQKQVIAPLSLLTKDVDVKIEEAKQATEAANTAAGKANDAAASVTQATLDLTTERKKVEDAVNASKTQTEAAKQATEATLASKADIESNETKRQAAETDRTKAEQSRVDAEVARASNETKRQDQETTRQSQESARQKAEQSRIDAEKGRATAETTRKSKETERVDAENKRAAAESGRVTAENTRATAEAKRQEDTKAAIKDCEDKTATAITSSKAQTDLAQELNEHPTKMGDNGNWWMWNLQTHAYEDTGIIARGGAMYPTFRQSRNKLLMIDYGSNVSEHVVKRRNKLVIKV